jgi:transcriptional regulator with XRE-family HTH domain
MIKPIERAHSRKALEAIVEIGHHIRIGRAEQNMTAKELAERAGISRALLYRIEHGDPNCSIGAVLEAATIVGVSQINIADGPRNFSTLDNRRAVGVRAIGPVRHRTKVVKDDF